MSYVMKYVDAMQSLDILRGELVVDVFSADEVCSAARIPLPSSGAKW